MTEQGISRAVNIGGAAAFTISLVHIGAAVFFYNMGTFYQLTPYYWASALVVAASLPYAAASIKGRLLPYEAIYIFLAGHVIGFTAWLFLPRCNIDLNLESWDYAMKAAFLGALFFLAGYISIFGKAVGNTLPLRRLVLSDANLFKMPMRLYLIGWFLRLIPRLSEAGIGIFDQAGILAIPVKILAKMQGWEITNMLTSYGICAAIMIDTYLYFSGNKKRAISVRLPLFLLLEIFNGFLSGMAQNTIRPFIFVFLAYMRARKKIPVIAIALTIILFVFYVVPFMKTFRQSYWYGNDMNQSVEYAKDALSDEKIFSDKRDESVMRVSNPLLMAALCYDYRKEGRKISTYNSIPGYISQFVPRFFWPNKPSVDYNRIGREMGMLNPDDYNTAISLTLTGGLIMDFGIYGVMAGMLIIGILLRVFWQWLVVRPAGNVFTFAVYSVLVYRFIFPDDFYALLHSTISFIIYTYFLASLVSRGPVQTYRQEKPI
jgi:hypothetical protein